jgi:hypothetical protein
MVTLAFGVFMEIQRQGGAVIDGTEAPGGAFEADGDIGVNGVGVPEHGGHVIAGVAPKGIDVGFGDLDPDMGYAARSEEVFSATDCGARQKDEKRQRFHGITVWKEAADLNVFLLSLCP